MLGNGLCCWLVVTDQYHNHQEKTTSYLVSVCETVCVQKRSSQLRHNCHTLLNFRTAVGSAVCVCMVVVVVGGGELMTSSSAEESSGLTRLMMTKQPVVTCDCHFRYVVHTARVLASSGLEAASKAAAAAVNCSPKRQPSKGRALTIFFQYVLCLQTR